MLNHPAPPSAHCWAPGAARRSPPSGSSAGRPEPPADPAEKNGIVVVWSWKPRKAMEQKETVFLSGGLLTSQKSMEELRKKTEWQLSLQGQVLASRCDQAPQMRETHVNKEVANKDL